MDVGTDYTAAVSAGFGSDWAELCVPWIFEQ